MNEKKGQKYGSNVPRDKLKKWKRKRLQTFLYFCLLYMINGMKYALFLDTCWE